MTVVSVLRRLALCGLVLAAASAGAQEAVIRKNIAERLPKLPKIDEVSKTPIPGLYELRIGSDIVYTDETGSYLIQGEVIDTRTKTNLTEQRVEKLSAFEWSKLPLKDAITFKQGTGLRKMAVFVDPNCGYCKHFERDLASLKDVTVYAFLYPILGPDSTAKSRDIWCSKDPAKTWRSWMLDGTPPPSADGAKCDASVLARNTELGKKHRVQGTPAAVFVDGSRLPGAVPGAELEKQLTATYKRG